MCVCVCVTVVWVFHAGQPKTSENLHKAIKRGDIELTRSILGERYVHAYIRYFSVVQMVT